MEKTAKGSTLLKLLRGAGAKSLPKKVQVGLRSAMKDEKPFVLAPVNWLASKVVGKKAVDNFWYKKFQRPISSLDIGTGQILQKGLDKLTGKRFGKRFFSSKKVLPMKSEKGFSTGGKEYYIPSGMAPAAKAGAIVVPMLGAMKAEELLKRKKNMDNTKTIKEADLKKTAAMLQNLSKERTLLKKEAKATKLLYKQAELGQIKMPSTFAEYQEKIAELLGKDLEIMEEAIKIAASAENDLGGLDESTRTCVDAQTTFQHAILD